MTDAEALLALLAVLYLFECAVLVAPGAVLLRASFPGRFRVVSPAALTARWKGAAALAPPLPPLGTTLVAEPWPLAPTDEGLASLEVPSFAVPWPEVLRIRRRGDELGLDGRVLARTSTRRAASSFLATARRLADAAPAGRAELLDGALRAHLDPAAVRERLAAFRPHARALLFAENALWLGLFAGGPLLLWSPLAAEWPRVLAWCGVSFAAAAWLALRAAKAVLPPDARPSVAQRVALVLSPLSTLRAHDVLARELAPDLHPLAHALALAPREDVARLARDTLAALRWPGAAAADPAAPFRDRLFAAASRVLREHGHDPDQLLAPPSEADPGAVAFCPRCLAQFRRSEGPCSTCAGVGLLPLPAEQATPLRTTSGPEYVGPGGGP